MLSLSELRSTRDLRMTSVRFCQGVNGGLELHKNGGEKVHTL